MKKRPPEVGNAGGSNAGRASKKLKAAAAAAASTVTPKTAASAPEQPTQQQQKKNRLEELESVIKEHLGTGKFFLVAAALREIDDQNLYEPEKSVYNYAKNKFAFSRRTTNTYLCSASVYASLAEDPTLPAPVSISHIRSLHKFTPDVRRFLWAQVTNSGQVITEETVASTILKYESGGTFSDLNSEIYSPKNIIAAAKQVIGKDCFDLDPASSSPANSLHINNLAAEFFDEASDGLSKAWYGDCWLSPPGGNDRIGAQTQAKWFFAAEEKYFKKEVNSIFILLRVDLGSTWFVRVQNYPHCYFHHKLIFSTPTKDKVAEDPYVLVYMGPNLAQFCDHFKGIGSIPGVNSWSLSRCGSQKDESDPSILFSKVENLRQTIMALETLYFDPKSRVRQGFLKENKPTFFVNTSPEPLTQESNELVATLDSIDGASPQIDFQNSSIDFSSDQSPSECNLAMLALASQEVNNKSSKKGSVPCFHDVLNLALPPCV
ncbi:hypothetical protein HDU97_003257 [Phlyctochytrium planicorne]|nr:hypothetical protein HDU97_003257 [Phlyctochytrium planicorne]